MVYNVIRIFLYLTHFIPYVSEELLLFFNLYGTINWCSLQLTSWRWGRASCRVGSGSRQLFFFFLFQPLDAAGGVQYFFFLIRLYHHGDYGDFCPFNRLDLFLGPPACLGKVWLAIQTPACSSGRWLPKWTAYSPPPPPPLSLFVCAMNEMLKCEYFSLKYGNQLYHVWFNLLDGRCTSVLWYHKKGWRLCWQHSLSCRLIISIRPRHTHSTAFLWDR